MSLLNIFRRNEVIDCKVLVAGLDSRFEDLILADSAVYKNYYESTSSCLVKSVECLNVALRSRYDIVHLFCGLASNGSAGDEEQDSCGTRLLQMCCESGVKLLWIASDNLVQNYINSFNPRMQRINLVMTIDRKGASFSRFLDRLLFRLSYGETMPIVWADLCPQIPDLVHRESPDCIFYAGAGGIRLRGKALSP